MAKAKKISGSLVYDVIQDFLIGENGSPTLSDPYRDTSGYLCFKHRDGQELDENDLVYWYKSLVEEGLIEDVLGISDSDIEVVDDFGDIEVVDDEDEDDDEDDEDDDY